MMIQLQEEKAAQHKVRNASRRVRYVVERQMWTSNPDRAGGR